MGPVQTPKTRKIERKRMTLSETRRIAKIILECGDRLLFSIKRAPGKPQKDQKLELIGGHVEDGETPLEGLIRELQEEEESGILAEKVRSLEPIPDDIPVQNTCHYIFRMPLSEGDLRHIRHSPSESHGYRLLHRSQPVVDPLRFTPKTIDIFAALERGGHGSPERLAANKTPERPAGPIMDDADPTAPRPPDCSSAS